MTPDEARLALAHLEGFQAGAARMQAVLADYFLRWGDSSARTATMMVVPSILAGDPEGDGRPTGAPNPYVAARNRLIRIIDGAA
jgi:hypothetical protein